MYVLSRYEFLCMYVLIYVTGFKGHGRVCLDRRNRLCIYVCMYTNTRVRKRICLAMRGYPVTWTAGSAYASVLPEPVDAAMTIFSRERRRGITDRCTGVGTVMLWAESAATISGNNPNDPNSLRFEFRSRFSGSLSFDRAFSFDSCFASVENWKYKKA